MGSRSVLRSCAGRATRKRKQMTDPDKFENRTLEKNITLINLEPETRELLVKSIVEMTEKIVEGLVPIIEKLAKEIAEMAQLIRDIEKNVKRRKTLIIRWIRRKSDPVPEEPQEKEEKEKTDGHRARAPPAWKEYVKGSDKGGKNKMPLEIFEKTTQERFEEAMVAFIERETKEPSSEETIKILPEMAHTLVAFWGINRPSH